MNTRPLLWCAAVVQTAARGIVKRADTAGKATRKVERSNVVALAQTCKDDTGHVGMDLFETMARK